NAEHQLAFIEMLRLIVDGQISPEDAVRAYHGVLQALGIKPYRSLEDDMQLLTPVMSYSGTPQVVVPAGGSNGGSPRNGSSAAASAAVQTGATASNGSSSSGRLVRWSHASAATPSEKPAVSTESRPMRPAPAPPPAGASAWPAGVPASAAAG